jgi:hypothetical protein
MIASSPPPPPSGSPAGDAPPTRLDGPGAATLAATALALEAQAVDASTDAAEAAATSAPHTRTRIVRVRRPARVVRRPPPASPSSAVASSPEAGNDTQSELRDWIKENAALLSNASLLISIAALAINFLPPNGLLNPYIQALIFGAALLLLIELHHQWPDDLQIHVFGRSGMTRQHSWRMTAFALLFQIATVLFALWATLNNPLILLPLTAFAVIIAFRIWYFRHHQGLVARIVGIVALVIVLLISELLMGIVWAVLNNQQITIELWTDR